MSDKKSLETKVADMTEREEKSLQEFIDEGLPGIGSVDENQIVRMFDLFKCGKSYNAISINMRVPKPIILFLSRKLNWPAARQEFYKELSTTLRQRSIEAEVLTQDTLISAIHMYNKKFGDKLNKYLATGNEEFTNQISLKEFANFLKTVEMLKKVTAPPLESKGPMVNVNIGSKATIAQTGPNAIEVTSNEDSEEKKEQDELKYYADLAREDSKKK